ncbi:hypothetical protein RRG08_020374 [Elysia crispata]|uniref:Uncharacterized protein n=1 Tax=Elysia crispata TaxID=231223 RepID=A0AAE1DBT9_9GAST|nr:hypothetical protein RRG08_020374 [Elysia crispata]
MGPSIERSITRPERRPTAGLRETRQGGLTQSTSARGETLTFHRDDICFSLVSETMQRIQVSRAAGRIFQQSSDLCKMRISFFVIFFLKSIKKEKIFREALGWHPKERHTTCAMRHTMHDIRQDLTPYRTRNTTGVHMKIIYNVESSSFLTKMNEATFQHT